jgi:hypothetical protein
MEGKLVYSVALIPSPSALRKRTRSVYAGSLALGLVSNTLVPTSYLSEQGWKWRDWAEVEVSGREWKWVREESGREWWQQRRIWAQRKVGSEESEWRERKRREESNDNNVVSESRERLEVKRVSEESGREWKRVMTTTSYLRAEKGWKWREWVKRAEETGRE